MTVDAPRRVSSRPPDPKYMTFVEHLQELRKRLIVCVAAIILGSIAGWFLAKPVINLITAPLRHYGIPLIVTDVYGLFTLQLKLAVIVGFVFALPITLYQIWAFVAPAFGPNANRWAPIWIGSALLLFAAGVVVGYFVIPLAIKFFAGFQGTDIKILAKANDYVGFISLILLVFGTSFELPLVLVSLSAAGVTSSRWLGQKRPMAFFGCFVFSTVATPGADLISPIILGGILYFLYEVSIIVSRLIGK